MDDLWVGYIQTKIRYFVCSYWSDKDGWKDISYCEANFYDGRFPKILSTDFVLQSLSEVVFCFVPEWAVLLLCVLSYSGMFFLTCRSAWTPCYRIRLKIHYVTKHHPPLFLPTFYLHWNAGVSMIPCVMSCHHYIVMLLNLKKSVQKIMILTQQYILLAGSGVSGILDMLVQLSVHVSVPQCTYSLLSTVFFSFLVIPRLKRCQPFITTAVRKACTAIDKRCFTLPVALYFYYSIEFSCTIPTERHLVHIVALSKQNASKFYYYCHFTVLYAKFFSLGYSLYFFLIFAHLWWSAVLGLGVL